MPCARILLLLLLLLVSMLLLYLSIAGRAMTANQEHEHSLVMLNQHKYDDQCGTIFQEISLSKSNGWEVATCKSKEYTSGDFVTCLQRANRTFTFVGDSRVRQLYHALINVFENNPKLQMRREWQNGFMEYRNGTAHIEFHWFAFLNGSIHSLLSTWLQTPASRPDVVVIGVGTWYVYALLLPRVGREEAAKYFSDYQDALQSIAPLLDELSKTTPVIWLAQAPCCHAHSASMTKYNAAAEAILNGTRVTFWNSAFQIARKLRPESPDGTHYSVNALRLLLSVILNFCCNSKMNISHKYCCSH